MKFRVSVETLRGSVERAAKVVDKTTRGSVRENIRFTLFHNRLQLTVVNDRVSLSDFFYLETDLLDGQNFSFLMKADTLISFLKSKNGDLDVSLKRDGEITFEYERGSYSDVWTQDALFPTIFLPREEDYRMTVKSGYFVPALKKSFVFLGIDEFRPIMEVVLLHIKTDKFNIVSTDLNRLYKSEFLTKETRGEEQEVLISETASSLLYDFLSDSDSVDIKVHSDGVRQFFSFGNTVISDMMLEAKYPPYQRVYDAFEDGISVRVNKKDFISSLSSSRLVCSSDNILLNVEIGSEDLKIWANDLSSRKKIIEKVPCEIVVDKNINATFSIPCRNLHSAVKNIDSSHLVLCLSAKGNAISVKDEAKENELMLCSTFK